MRKNYLFAIMAAALLSACSNDLKDVQGAPELAQNTELQNTVQFDAYMNRATTRAGAPGELSNIGDTGKLALGKGFGVFGYYTDDDFYSPIYAPNFMYNTKVEKPTGDETVWSYSPVMYWPNEFGGDAFSVGVDRVSFFAYAPWVEVTPTSGAVAAGEDETGIIGLSRNGAVGDPFVKYAVSLDPAKAVDLAWGVAKENFTSSASSSVTNNVAAGAPYLNLVKPAVGAKINFDFKHALAKLNVQIDAAVDAVAPGNELDKNTRIFVRSITFNGFAMKGALNLNSSTANWYDLSGNGYLEGSPVTIYDGRSNGYEATAAAANELPQGLNKELVQMEPYTVSGSDIRTTTKGVTERAQNLFAGDAATTPIYVIPTGQNMSVTIVYDVETYNPDLSGYLSDGTTHGSSVQNSITQNITDFKLEAGKSHTLKLHLGMASVQFEAKVADWDAADPAEVEMQLPVNTEPDYSKMPFTVEALEGGTISAFVAEGVVKYSLNGGEKQTLLPSQSFLIDVSAGDKIELFGTNGVLHFYRLTRVSHIVYGNIMSLIDENNYSTREDLPVTFTGMFSANDKLIDAKNLILPATTLVEGCYEQMFYECASLRAAPDLPATTLAKNCYADMFSGCTSLRAAPDLPATTLAEGCYKRMFTNCALTVAPVLPATTLVNECYRMMFAACSNLNSITCFATDISAQDCTKNWLARVAATGTFTKASGIDWPENFDGIPTGWTVNEQ